jgi:hypothetical protein
VPVIASWRWAQVSRNVRRHTAGLPRTNRCSHRATSLSARRPSRAAPSFRVTFDKHSRILARIGDNPTTSRRIRRWFLHLQMSKGIVATRNTPHTLDGQVRFCAAACPIGWMSTCSSGARLSERQHPQYWYKGRNAPDQYHRELAGRSNPRCHLPLERDKMRLLPGVSAAAILSICFGC